METPGVPDGGFVLCVGMPLQQVGEVARLLRGRSVVIATSDTDSARMLLGPTGAGPGPVRRTWPSDPVGRHAAPPTGAVPAVPAPRTEPQAQTGSLPTVHPATGAVPVVSGDPYATARLVRGPLEVDLAAREVTARGDRIHLSMREFDLLAALASDVDRVWSFAELTHHVWRTGYLGDPDPVISAVKRLRKRLVTVPDLEIASVRGVGYRLLVPV
jgi:hypothetical protein